MTNIISLVGRTNVGKSLLFNKLTQYKNSIVLNKHGVTRDVNQGKLLLKINIWIYLILQEYPHRMNVCQSFPTKKLLVQ